MHRSPDLFLSTYLTKVDVKMTKMKKNYIVNMIMNVSGKVCQLIHYFPGNQGLAINLPWPALKSKNARVLNFLTSAFKGRGGGGGRNFFFCFR